MTFLEASLIARDPTRTVSVWVIKPGDTSWDEDPAPVQPPNGPAPGVREGNAPMYLEVMHMCSMSVAWSA